MRKLKQQVAAILAVMMMVTSINLANAATTNFADVSAKYSPAVSRLTSIEILKGYEDGTFKPEGTITRAEAAAVMVRMLGKDKLATYSAGLAQFSDMTASHWANGYINVAAGAGLVKGYPNGTFAPEAKVTYAEVVTMMVRALGAGEAVGANGVWPNNFLNFALSEGLTDDVAVVPNAPATRGDVAIIGNETLDTTVWEATGYNTDGTRTYAKATDENKTLFTDKLELTKYEMATISASLGVTNDPEKFGAVKKGAGASTVFTFIEGMSKAVYPGEEVDIWVDDNNEVVMVQHAKDSKQKVVPFLDVVDNTSQKVELKLADGTKKTYEYGDTVIALLAGTPLAGQTAINILDGQSGLKGTVNEELDLVGRALVNKDGDVEFLYTYNYNRAFVVKEVKVTNETKYTIKADTDMPYTTTSLSYDIDDDVVYVNNARGQAIRLADIKAGDVVAYTNSTNGNYLRVYPLVKVEGTVEATDPDALEINGKEYKYNPNFTDAASPKDLIEDVKADDTVVAYLDILGQIGALEKVTGGSSTSGDYGVITDFYAEDPDSKGNIKVMIEIANLASGERTGLKQLDAEQTDEEADTNNTPATLEEPVFRGQDFYNHTTEKVNGGDYTKYVNTVVKYDVTSTGKVVLYAVEDDEIVRAEKTYTVKVAAIPGLGELLTVNGTVFEFQDTATAAAAGHTKINVQVNNTKILLAAAIRAAITDADLTVSDDGVDTVTVTAKVDADATTKPNYTPVNVTIVDGTSADLTIAKVNNASIDVSKNKFTVNSKAYYVSNDSVKVSQATEKDSDDVLTVKTVSYDTLKDTTSLEMILVELDDDKENAEYVYIPYANNAKQTLSKANGDKLGVITRVREITSDDIEVTVMTKDGEDKFYVDEDERGDVTATPIAGGSIDLEDTTLTTFEGLLVSYSADADKYVTSENLEFSNKVKVAKFYEVNGRNEVELLGTNNSTPEFDAYATMFTAEADITGTEAKVTLDTAAGIDLTVKATIADGYNANGIKIATAAAPANAGVNDLTVTEAGGTITIALDSETANNTTAAIQAGLRALTLSSVDEDSWTVTGDVVTIVGAIAATAMVADVTAVAFDDVEVSEVGTIDEADEDTTSFDVANIAEANTVYYYTVEVDEDGELVDLNAASKADTDNVESMAVMLFDPSEF